MLEQYESDAYTVSLRDFVRTNDNSCNNCVENNSSAVIPNSLHLFVSSYGYQDWKTKRLWINEDMMRIITEVKIISHYDRFCKCLLIVNWVAFYGKKAILPTTTEIIALLKDTDPSTSKICKTSRYMRAALLMKMVTCY